MILQDGARRFERDALIRYTLACYESVLGDFHAAHEWLEKAFTLDPKLRLIALEDDDLRTFWVWRKEDENV